MVEAVLLVGMVGVRWYLCVGLNGSNGGVPGGWSCRCSW